MVVMGGLDSAVAVKRKWTEDDQDQLNAVEALLDVHLGLPCHLPTFKQVQESRDEYVGPTDESNWVIPGKLLVGAYPAEASDSAHEERLSSILACGVTTFVCLQSEYDHMCRDRAAWCEGKKIRPYIHDAHRICSTLSVKDKRVVSPEHLSFWHCPIMDCDVVSDEVTTRLARALCWRLVAGDVIYLHCWGGHGRTGTIVAVMLGMLYKISKAEALKRTQLYHDMRAYPLQVPSPQTFSQRMQVLRVLDAVKDESGVLELYRKDRTTLTWKQSLGMEFMLPIEGQHQAACSRDIFDVCSKLESGPLRPSTRSKRLKRCGSSSGKILPRPLQPPSLTSASPSSRAKHNCLGHLR
mmetsp:Transcript_19221/g.34210  ORF Transcript_19221/g.34210 Transcript_19221/m.34210 type:complete len:353 (-) Transcript_19221:316-1374(-)